MIVFAKSTSLLEEVCLHVLSTNCATYGIGLSNIPCRMS